MCAIRDLASAGGGLSPIFAVKPAPQPGASMKREAQRDAASRAMPKSVGAKGRRTLIKGGTILSMDERVGDHATGDVLIEG